jgi:hypothetical protein
MLMIQVLSQKEEKSIQLAGHASGAAGAQSI